MEKKIIKKKASLKTEKIASVKAAPVVVVAPVATVVSNISLNHLTPPKGANDRKKLLGRGPGSGHGKTSTRGSKGQTSRAGRDMYVGFEGGQTPMIRRMPKRGFTSKFKKVYQILNLRDLTKIKETAITPELLELKGIIKDKGKLIKILGVGEVKHAISVKAHAFSKQAQEKLKNSGSTFEVLNA